MGGSGEAGKEVSLAPAQGWTTNQIIIVLLCCMINMLDGMDVLIVSFIAPALSEQWHVGPEALGGVFSAGLAGMMIGSIFLAPLADFVGRRVLILAGIALLSVGTIASGMVPSVGAFALCRLVVGCGIGALIASVAALVSETAPPHRTTFAIGIFQAGYPLGAVLTGFLSIWAIPRFGWQATLVGAGLASTVLIPILWRFLPATTVATTEPARSTGRVRELVADGMWIKTVCLWVSTLLSYGVLYFVTSWIPKLATKAGLDPTDALYAGAIFNVGGFFGGLLMGQLALRTRVGTLIVAFFCCSALAMLAFSVPVSLLVTLCIAFLIGFTLQGGFTGYYSLGALLYPARVRSSGIGWAVGIGRAGSIVGPVAGGFLLAQDLALWLVFLCFAIPLVVAGIIAFIVGRNVRPPALNKG